MFATLSVCPAKNTELPVKDNVLLFNVVKINVKTSVWEPKVTINLKNTLLFKASIVNSKTLIPNCNHGLKSVSLSELTKA